MDSWWFDVTGQLEQRKLDFRNKIYKNRFTKQTAVAVVLFFLCFSCMYRISYSLCCWPHVSIMRNRFCHFYHPQTQNFMGGISIIPRHGSGFMAWGGIMDDGPMGVLIKIGHGI